MNTVEILSLGKSDIGCTKERWREVFKDYLPRARQYVAVLAAHNWDVLLVGDRVFLSGYYSSRGSWLRSDLDAAYGAMEDATEAEVAALYDSNVHPKFRRFLSESPQ